MKHWDKDRIKRIIKRAVTGLFSLGLVLVLIQNEAAAFDAQEVVEQLVKDGSRGIIYLFKWTPLLNGNDARQGENYVTMLNEKNKTISGTNLMKKGDDWAQLQVSENYTPYSYGKRSATDYFYTLGSMGAPIIYNVKDDDDNNGYEHTYWLADSEYPYAPRQAINRDGGGDWDEFSRSYGVDLSGNGAYADWIRDFCDNTIAEKELGLGQYNSKVSYFTLCKVSDGGKFMIMKNIGGKRDPAWQCYGNGNIWCDQEDDNGDRCWFNVWYGDPVAYSSLTQSYTIGGGQTLTLDSETENYRGIYILPTVTLKVEKGGTLAINENVYNDGTILCDGGTVIIQGNGSLSPLSKDGTDSYNTDGKNKIIIQNGGVLIIMPEGKLYTTPKYPMTLINSRLINFGNYVLGGDLELYCSTVENRQGGNILCGWNYEVQDMRACFESEKIENGVLVNGTMVNNYPSTVTVCDSYEHNQKYNWLTGTPVDVQIDLQIRNGSKNYTEKDIAEKIQEAIAANSKNLSGNYRKFT